MLDPLGANRKYGVSDGLMQPDVATDGFDLLPGIKSDAVLEHQFYVFHVGDTRDRIPGDHHQIGLLAFGDPTQLDTQIDAISTPSRTSNLICDIE